MIALYMKIYICVDIRELPTISMYSSTMYMYSNVNDFESNSSKHGITGQLSR